MMKERSKVELKRTVRGGMRNKEGERRIVRGERS